MKKTGLLWGRAIALLALAGLFALAGCGGSSGSNGGSNGGSGAGAQYKLAQPVEIPSAPGSVGGSIFTMAPRATDTAGIVLIDSASNGVVTLTGTTATGTTLTPMQVATTNRGGYSFASVPAGTYTVSATASSPNIAAGVILSASVSGVVVRGNIPTLMVNLLLGASGANQAWAAGATYALGQSVAPSSANGFYYSCTVAGTSGTTQPTWPTSNGATVVDGSVTWTCCSPNMCTFTGTITQDGRSAGGATVTVDVTAHTTDYPGDPTALSTIGISTTTNINGIYQLIVPGGGTDYYIDAHSTTSMLAQTGDMNSPLPVTTTPNVVNLPLTDASTPTFGVLSLDIVSSTLPAPTAAASNQALMSKIAIARMRNAPSAYQTRLQQLRSGKLSAPARRTVSGMVENDLYWGVSAATSGQAYSDVGVRGFNVYRATAASAPFVLTGTVPDAYLWYFFDNDPALSDFASRYYTVTSYAANGQESTPATAIAGQPLPPITCGLTQAGNPVTNGTISIAAGGAFTWASVPGALSYVVLKYTENPTFNDTPVTSLPISTATATSEPLSGDGLAPGTYWWSVQAFNTSDPNAATAASYSSFQKVVVTN